MSVLLLNPWYEQRIPHARSYPADPLGLLQVATAVRQQSLASVSIIDCHLEGSSETFKTERGWRSGLTNDELTARVKTLRPTVVGIHCNYTYGAASVLEIARLVKRARPHAEVVLGGAHATLDHAALVQHPDIDWVCVGEGEQTFSDFMKRGPVPGMIGKKHPLVPRPPLPGDQIPIPDRSFVCYSRYLEHPNYFHTRQSPVGTVSTSRGCMFRCTFCSTAVSWGHTWRGRSAESMVRECLDLQRDYGVREVAFQDDQLLGSVDRMKDFCRLMIQAKSGLTLLAPPGMSPGLMDEELLELMAKAGFYRILFSVDTGMQKTARQIKKPVQLHKIRPLVKKANSLGLWTYGTFVIGFPEETEADVRETVRYAWHLGLDFVRFYIAQPHLGSALYYYWHGRGKIDRQRLLEDCSPMDALFGTDHLTAEQLVTLRNEAEMGYMRHYLLTAWRRIGELVPKLLGVRKLFYALKLVWLSSAVRIKFNK